MIERWQLTKKLKWKDKRNRSDKTGNIPKKRRKGEEESKKKAYLTNKQNENRTRKEQRLALK